jgi:hypothetical protein
MSGFIQNLLRDAAGAFFGSDYLRDYTHASKTFRTNSYQNAPKFKFLFHTYFEINPDAFVGFYSRGVGSVDASTNFGLLVKEVKLPSYSFNTTQLNQYNRKRIIQTKIKYDPVEITFHDDNGDQINQLWEAYYTYYYNDALNPNVQFAGSRGSAGNGPNNYNERNIYNPSISDDDFWGYNAESPNGAVNKVPFFKSITVFGFNQHNFTAYTLVNPIITNFSHDQYSYSEGGGIMQNRMSIDYETVVYNYGAIDGRSPGDIVTGFGDAATYDRRVSPIANPGANGTILGQGGLVDGVGGTLDALARGDILGAIKTAGTTYNTFKNVNLKTVAKQEVTAMLIQSVQQTPNTRNTLFNFPTAGGSPGSIGTAGTPPIGALQSPPVITSEPVVGTQFNGSDLTTGFPPPNITNIPDAG